MYLINSRGFAIFQTEHCVHKGTGRGLVGKGTGPGTGQKEIKYKKRHREFLAEGRDYEISEKQ